MFSYIKKGLVKLGIMRKTVHVVMLGLDNSGKTTFRYILSDNQAYPPFDPYRKICSQVTIQNTNLNIYEYDVGHYSHSYWQKQHQSNPIQAIIYLIDLCDLDRLEEAKEQLIKILEKPELAGIPVLIFGNKIDKQGAVQLTLEMLLDYPKFSQNRQLKYFPCTIVKRLGHQEGFDWLLQNIV